MEMECHRNINALHGFIERWLKGSIEKTRRDYQYFSDALDEDFIIIHPSGEQQDRPGIVNDLWHAHGTKSENFTIEIREVQFRSASENICIMTYEEWQTGAEVSVRISTVVFQKSEHSGKYGWLHLHETWHRT